MLYLDLIRLIQKILEKLIDIKRLIKFKNN